MGDFCTFARSPDSLTNIKNSGCMVAGIRCQKYATNMEKNILLLYNILYNNRHQNMRMVSYFLVAQLCNLQPSNKNR